MKIEIVWQKPLLLSRHWKIRYNEKRDLKKIERRPGVYFFSRKYGKQHYPFYIGESGNLRNRFRQHMQSARIVLALMGERFGSHEEILAGARYFHYGYLQRKRGQNRRKCLDISQKAMIAEAISNDCQLLNKNLVEVRTDTIRFSGNKHGIAIFPKLKTVEAS